jgi:hypothetical protein
MTETWADRRDYAGKRAELVRCPCCGRLRAADMIVRVASEFAALDAETAEACRRELNLATAPEFMCTGRLSRLHRRQLVTRATMAGRK